MYFTVELAGGSPQYTFTCISTGAPVNYARWFILYYDDDYYYFFDYYHYDFLTRGEAVLNDSMTAQYIMTLTVTELEVYYFCEVYYSFAYSVLKIEGN